MYNSIMARLRSGEAALDIANEYADILNKAVADYEAEVEAAKKAEEEAKAKAADRETAISKLTDAYNSFFDTIFPGFGSVSNDMVSGIMSLVEDAFKNSNATGYKIESKSVNGEKPKVKVTTYGDSDGKIAAFLKKNNL